MDDKNKAAAAKLRQEINEHLKSISERLVQMSKLHGGDGYEFECRLAVMFDQVQGTLSGKAFKVVDGQLEYLPDALKDADKPVGEPASVVVSRLLKSLGIKELE